MHDRRPIRIEGRSIPPRSSSREDSMLTGRWSVAVLISALAIPVPRPAQVLATTMAWTPNGIPASPADGAQIKPRIVPDGSGGALSAWEDKRVGQSLASPQQLHPARP